MRCPGGFAPILRRESVLSQLAISTTGVGVGAVHGRDQPQSRSQSSIYEQSPHRRDRAQQILSLRLSQEPLARQVFEKIHAALCAYHERQGMLA